MVKLLACRERGPGFFSWSHRYNFRDWLSLVLLPSCDIAEILLKRRKSSTNQFLASREANRVGVGCVDKNFNLGHFFLTIKDRAFIFHMCIPYDKTFHMVP